MTALELQLGVLEAMRRFYSWPTILASGVASALGHLPDLTSAARPALLRRLPTIARLAWARVNAALWLPAVRFCARRQLAAWWEQDGLRAHLKFLASLSTSTASPGAPAVAAR
jgi:hypothetical protein